MEDALDYTAKDILDHAEQIGADPLAAAQALQNWRSEVLKEGRKKAGDDVAWFAGGDKFDREIMQPALAAVRARGTMTWDDEEAATYSQMPAFYLPATRRIRAPIVVGGQQVGSFDLRPDPEGVKALVYSFQEDKEGKKPQMVLDLEQPDPEKIQARRQELTRETTAAQAKLDEYRRQGFGSPLGLGTPPDMASTEERRQAGLAELEQLNGPNPELADVTSQIARKIQSPELRGKFGKMALGEDFWRAITGFWTGSRVTWNDLTNDPGERDEWMAIHRQLPQLIPGTNRALVGGVGKVASELTETAGGAAQPMLPALVGGIPALVGRGSLTASPALAGAARAAGLRAAPSYAELLRGASLGAITAQTYGGALTETPGQPLRAGLTAATEVGTELIFPEEMLFRRTGQSIGKRVINTLAQNAVEESTAQAAEGNLIDPLFGLPRGTPGQVLKAGLYGAAIGAPAGVIGGVAERLAPEGAPAAAPPEAAAAPPAPAPIYTPPEAAPVPTPAPEAAPAAAPEELPAPAAPTGQVPVSPGLLPEITPGGAAPAEELPAETAAPFAPAPGPPAITAAGALPEGQGAIEPGLLTPPTEADPLGTIPESPDTLAEQRRRVVEGTLPGMQFPGTAAADVPPEFHPQPNENLLLTDTPGGAVLHPTGTDPNATPDFLRYGTETRPTGATQAMVLRNAAGTEVRAPVFTPETEAPVRNALEAIQQPGDTISVEDPTAVAQARVTAAGLPEEAWRSPDRIVNPIDPALPPAQKVEALQRLSAENAPRVQGAIDAMKQELGLVGKLSFKKPENILAKASRPTIRSSKPWHDVEHVRDALRFKAPFQRLEDMPAVLDILRRQGFTLVKTDTGKLARPKEWGWRFVAFDLRAPNGQLIEFYSPPAELDSKTVKGPNHLLFEKWRQRDVKTMSLKEVAEMERDRVESVARYEGAWQAAIHRMGFADERAALASWTNVEARLLSQQGSKSSLSSSAVGRALGPKTQPPASSLRPKSPLSAEGQIITAPLSPTETGGTLATPNLTPPAPAGQAQAVEPPPTQSAVIGPPIVEVPLDRLTLSQDVPQFKRDADASGIVEPLGGKFDRRGVGPIQVWRRRNGRLEIISGRHRWDLAKRSGEKTIPAQIYNETDGFTERDAAILDAELNIRDGQGSVGDFANYFRNSPITESEADARGLLARAKGKAGFTIGRLGSNDTFSLHQSEKITDAQAEAIATTAPGDSALQAVGLRSALSGQSATTVANFMRAAKLAAVERAAAGQQGDLFGFDDSALREMEKQAKVASAEQRGITDQIAAVRGAAKRPELARKLGVNVKDPNAVLRRVGELQAELARWQNWPMHPDLVAHTRGQKFEAAPAAPPAVSEALALAPGQRVTEDDLQQYLDFNAVPKSRQAAAQEALQKANAVRISGGGVAYGERARRRKFVGKFFKGLQAGDIPALQEAFAAAGETISAVMHDLVAGQIPKWDVRGHIISSPADLAMLNLAIRTPYFETTKIAVVDKTGMVIHSQILTTGALNEAVIRPADLVRVIELARAANPGVELAGFFFAHNHPSGVTAPSSADDNITTRIERTAQAIGVPLIDHVITDGDDYYSYVEKGRHVLPPVIKDATGGKPIKGKFGKMAPWEAIPGKARVRMERQDRIGILQTLETADPDHDHAIFLDTRLRIIGIDRLPKGMPTAEYVKRILSGAARIGTYGIITSTSLHYHDPASGAALNFQALRHAADAANVRLIDGSFSDMPSAENRGVLEEPPFQLVGQTEAELRAEREAQQRADQQQVLAARAAAPLTGDSSALGQGQLFAEDADLFSGPSAQVQEGAPAAPGAAPPAAAPGAPPPAAAPGAAPPAAGPGASNVEEWRRSRWGERFKNDPRVRQAVRNAFQVGRYVIRSRGDSAQWAQQTIADNGLEASAMMVLDPESPLGPRERNLLAMELGWQLDAAARAAEQQGDRARMESLDEVAEQVGVSVEDNLNQAGGILSDVNIYWSRMSPAGIVRRFQRHLQETMGRRAPQIPQDVIDRITDLARRARALPLDSPLRHDLHREIMAELARVRGVSAADMITAFWYANVLSGFGTHGVNLGSTWANMLARGLATAVTSHPRDTMAMLRGMFTTGMQRSALEAARAARGQPTIGSAGGRFQDIGAGVEAGDVEGFIQQNALELLYTPDPHGWRQLIGNFFALGRFVFRSLASEDVANYYVAREGRIHLAASRLARQRARLNGTQYEAEMANALGSSQQAATAAEAEARRQLAAAGLPIRPGDVRRLMWHILDQARPPDVIEEANRFGAQVIFTNDPEGSAAWATAVGNALAGLTISTPFGDISLGRFGLAPFVRIIANVTSAGLDFTPIGALRAMHGRHLTQLPLRFKGRENTRFSRQERAERFAASVLGTVAMGIMYGLIKDQLDKKDPNIMLHGAGPPDEKRRKQLLEQGWMPYSLEIGGKYYRFGETPLAYPFAVLGGYADSIRYGLHDEKGAMQRVTYALAAAPKVWLNSGFLSQFKNVLLGLDGKIDPARIMTRPATGFIPAGGLLRDVDRLFGGARMDDTQVGAAWYRDVPFVRHFNRPALNVFGDPITIVGPQRIPTVARFVSGRTEDPDMLWLSKRNLYIPGRSSDEINIGDTGIKLQVPKQKLEQIRAQRATTVGRQFDRILNDDETYRFWRRAGELTRRGVQMMRHMEESGQLRDPDHAQKVLDSFTTSARRQALQEIALGKTPAVNIRLQQLLNPIRFRAEAMKPAKR
jgi:hypothetical protein